MTKYRLKSIVWEITLACCFSCKYCGSSGGKARENELTTEECISIVDQLAELHCERVNLIGGEVFMRRDWAEIVAALRNRGIRVTIITNGFLFRSGLIEVLKALDIESVAVSLDGPREIHDKYRQEGSYDRALRAITVLTEAEIPVSVISTLNAENVKTLSILYETLKEYPIFAWQLQACSPMGNAANGGTPWRFSFREAIDFVESHRRIAPFALGVADNIGYYTETEGSLRGVQNGRFFFTGCRAGLTTLGIDSVGNVRGCESMYDPRFNEGNLREKTLREIWEDDNAFSYNRGFKPSNLTGKCSSCPEAFRCAGGCRSYNFFTHGLLYENIGCARGE
ncbi:MAG: radical SAM protein [Lachnospiraceae bacterium]|nr:radical SAM protein [Lachnospiraceae bacterium]